MRKGLEKERKRILKIIFDKGLITPEEYETEYKGKYIDDRYGLDSFMSYLSYVAEFNLNCFLTSNDKIWKDRKKLEKKFGIKIISLEEFNKK